MTSAGAALEPGRNCWRVAEAERFAVIVDAADYFAAARVAMLAARKSILLVGWDFDARMLLGPADDGGPERLGDFILWLADRSPALEIRLLRWDIGALKSVLRGNTLWTVLRWKAHPRITLRFDGAHPVVSAQHHKIVSIDDSIAFCGGIDMTLGRWDTPEHLDGDPRRIGPDDRAYEPWHDTTSVFDGAAAQAIGELARTQWERATGESLSECADRHDCWPRNLQPMLTKLRLGVARSRPALNGIAPVYEIEQAYLDLIASAKRILYVENQYFASRKIARAIAERLLEEDGPEIVVINPSSSEGWLEPLAMDTARARLVEALQRLDRHRRFRLYHPQTTAGADIYVHAKLMIVDDTALRVGSSNLNNRSLRLDTECDVILSAVEPGCEHVRSEIAALRDGLLAEHLSVERAEIAARLAETGSLIAVIEALRVSGRTLVPYATPELSGLEEWVADNEILDPSGPEEIFESPARRGLFKGWDRLRNRFRLRR